MFTYRITKYDTKKRDKQGFYTDFNEWTSVYDVEISSLTYKEYLLYENGYIYAIFEILLLNKIIDEKNLNLEIKNVKFDFEFNFNKHNLNKKSYYLTDVEDLIKKALREEINFSVNIDNKVFIQFGYDLYMYVKSIKKINYSKLEFNGIHLYIEEMLEENFIDYTKE